MVKCAGVKGYQDACLIRVYGHYIGKVVTSSVMTPYSKCHTPWQGLCLLTQWVFTQSTLSQPKPTTVLYPHPLNSNCRRYHTKLSCRWANTLLYTHQNSILKVTGFHQDNNTVAIKCSGFTSKLFTPSCPLSSRIGLHSSP